MPKPFHFSKSRLAELISEHSMPYNANCRPHWLRVDTVEIPSGRIILACGKKKISAQWSIRGGALNFEARGHIATDYLSELLSFLDNFMKKVILKSSQ